MPLDDEPDPDWAWEGGVMVGQSHEEFFWIKPQIFNWRLMTVPKNAQMVYTRWWCYQGRDLATLTIAVYAGVIWDGEGDPLGWSKNGQTQEWRQREDALREFVDIAEMVPEKLQRFHDLVDQAASGQSSPLRFNLIQKLRD